MIQVQDCLVYILQLCMLIYSKECGETADLYLVFGPANILNLT